MRMEINGQGQAELLNTLGEQPMLHEAVASAARAIESRGEVVTRIAIDGEDLTGGAWNEQAERRDVELLEITAMRPADLVRDTITTSKAWVDPVRQEVMACADRFRKGEDERAVEQLVRVVDGLRLLLTGVIQMSNLATNTVKELPLEDTSAWRDSMTALLDELIESQQNQDWVLLADLLEYELCERLDQWSAIADELLAKLQQEGS